MKHLLSGILIATTAPLWLSSCEQLMPEGEIVTKNFSLPAEVSKIEIGNGIKVVIDDEMKYGEYSISTNQNIQPLVKAETDQSHLKLYVDTDQNFQNLEINVSISKDQFDSFNASGGSVIESYELLEATAFTITLSGGSKFKSPLKATRVNVTLSGGSVAELSDSCQTVVLQSSGGSQFSDYNFVCNKAIVSLSGGSFSAFTATEQISGAASGASTLYYKGDAELDIEISNDVEVKKKS